MTDQHHRATLPLAPLAAFYYVISAVFAAQSGANVKSGTQWAAALQAAVPPTVVELGIIWVVLLWANAMSTDPASRTARVIAVATTALCASIVTSFFVGLAAWPVLLLSCVAPAALAAPAVMRSATAATQPAREGVMRLEQP